MATDSVKEKVAISATEQKTTFIPVESCTPTTVCQCCLLCKNTREVPCSYGNCYPWVCNECKEAIAFMKKQLKRDPLEPILD